MDMNRFRLRTMLDALAAVGDLDAHSGATPLSHVARLLQDSDKAVFFEQGGAEGQALVGNVMSSRRRLARCCCSLRRPRSNSNSSAADKEPPLPSTLMTKHSLHFMPQNFPDLALEF